MNFYLIDSADIDINNIYKYIYKYKEVGYRISHEFICYILEKNIVKEDEIPILNNIDPFAAVIIKCNLNDFKKEIELLSIRLTNVDLISFEEDKKDISKLIIMIQKAIDNNLLIFSLGDWA